MVEVRQAERADADAVTAFTSRTWTDREQRDYLPDVFAEWVASDDPAQRTLVAEVDGEVVGCCQGVLLTDHEAWAQGMRVAGDARNQGVGAALTGAAFDWAAAQGATVMRNLVFSWNGAGLGLSRAAGFEPVTEFRWAFPRPSSGAEPALSVSDDPDAAWTCWQASRAARRLRGLGLDLDETWAVREVTRDLLARAADETRVLALQDDGGTRAATYRVRTVERETEDGERETWAEYGLGCWTDADACRALFDAVATDAAALGADRTRIVVPESARHVSDAALARADISDHSDFVTAADLTAR
ncbi:MAG: N-acetyltransferase family protein [Haloarculaceae archaeon]